mgnify:CR=1 FL=1
MHTVTYVTRAKKRQVGQNWYTIRMNAEVVSKINTFFSKYRSQEYKKGETIIHPDEEIPYIFFLESGFVGQYSYTENGNKIAVHIFRPLSFFPIMLVLAQKTNQYYFETMTPIKVRKAPKPEVLEFIRDNSDVSWDLLQRLAMGMSGLSERITHLMFTDRYKRVVSLLIWLAKGFGEKEKEKVTIQFTITHDDIASWVNLARETASQQIETLEKKGLVIYENHHIIIPNLNKLQAEM